MFKKKTLSSLPPEQAGTFSEFDKSDKSPTRKSIFSKNTSKNDDEIVMQENMSFQMSDSQREMLRNSNVPKQKTEEEKRAEQEK